MAEHKITGYNGASMEKTLSIDLPSNSHKQKQKEQEQKNAPVRVPLEKAITGDVVKKKKSLTSKVAETFFTGEDAKQVGSYVLFDVVLPALKALIVDAGKEALERRFYGDSSARRGSSKPGAISYSRFYYNGANREAEKRRELSQRARTNHEFDQIIFETRGEAETVLERLMDQIDMYDVASVSDLYDLVGLTGSFTDDKWGWTDLRGATINRVRQGYVLDLPKVYPID